MHAACGLWRVERPYAPSRSVSAGARALFGYQSRGRERIVAARSMSPASADREEPHTPSHEKAGRWMPQRHPTVANRYPPRAPNPPVIREAHIGTTIGM